jgi:hypothetical protein
MVAVLEVVANKAARRHHTKQTGRAAAGRKEMPAGNTSSKALIQTTGTGTAALDDGG